MAVSPSISESLVERLVRPDVLAMHTYAVQDGRGMFKMDAMENPHRLPLHLQEQLGQRLGALAFNRYPGERIEELRDALAAHAQIPPSFGIMLGNGSDELIALLALACDVPGACILAPEPGFVMYRLNAQLQGLKFVGVPLNADFELDEGAMLGAVALHRPSIIYLAYPNNPTANLWNEGVIDKIIAAAPGLVVIDEAYQPFAGTSFMGRIARYEHVLLMRTMSKFGLAGVRIGYLVGPQALVGEIDKVRPPYNISVLNAECGLFALEHAEVFAAQASDIVAQRERLLSDLRGIAGLQVYPSDANMILLRVLDGPSPTRANAVFQRMKDRKVLVKNVSTMHPLLSNCLRLTVGTAEENSAMLAALKESL